MPITDAYVTVEEFREIAGRLDASKDPAILNALLTITRMIEGQLHQCFNIETAAVARTYIGDGSRCLQVDNIGSTSGLEIKIDADNDGTFSDETALATTDYELLPRNAAVGSEPSPWYEIYLPIWSTRTYWPHYRIQVTAKYGWPAVPQPVKRATVELSRILLRVNDMNELLNLGKAQDVMRDLTRQYYVPVFA